MNDSSMKPLGKEQFWQIIDNAREAAGGWQGMIEPLVEALSQFEEPDIVRFKQINDEYQRLAYKEKLWAAAYVLNNGCSDDGFIDFRAWLIAQGKEVYMNALADPDSLADLGTVRDLSAEVKLNEYTPPNGYFYAAGFESFTYAANDAYKNKLGGDADIYDVIDTPLLSEREKADIAGEIIYAADIDVKWGGIDTPHAQIDANLNKILPSLAELFHMYVFRHRRYPSEVNEEAIPTLVSPLPTVEKKSVLEQIKQDRQSKNAVDKQPQEKSKNKSKKTKKSGPEL